MWITQQMRHVATKSASSGRALCNASKKMYIGYILATLIVVTIYSYLVNPLQRLHQEYQHLREGVHEEDDFQTNDSLPDDYQISKYNLSEDQKLFQRDHQIKIKGAAFVGDGSRVISMSLYGNGPKYIVGAIRNAQMLPINFPGWKLRLYCPKTTSPSYPNVPQVDIDKLRDLGAEIHWVSDFTMQKIPPMMWRFLVVDDPDVDYFLVRDADSRLTARYAAAVADWLSALPAAVAAFHCIRDHPSHSDYPISGGLWGGQSRQLRTILQTSMRTLMSERYTAGYLQDMLFLRDVIWPQVMTHAYCNDCCSCKRYPNSHPFPVKRHGLEHVGQVFNEYDEGRTEDMQILMNANPNPLCVPA